MTTAQSHDTHTEGGIRHLADGMRSEVRGARTRVICYVPEEFSSSEAALRAYTERQLVTGAGCFACQHEQRCRASMKPGWQLITGESPYIGRRYALQDDEGRKFRIVYVGKERGGDDLNLTIDGAKMRLKGFVDRNNESKHLSGCYFATRRLLLGAEPQTFTLDHSGVEEWMQVDGAPVHLSELFALMNAVSCSAKPPGAAGTRKASPTPTMKDNCGAHLYEMLKAAAPTVVVVQGDAAHESLSGKILGLHDKPSDRAFVAKLGERKTVWCSFSHPSARNDRCWYRQDQLYAQEVVGPQLEVARRLLLASEVT